MSDRQPLRMLFLVDLLEIGGIQRQLLEVCRAMAARGDAVTLLCFRPERDRLSAAFREAGVEVVFLAKRRAIDLAFFLALRRFLRARTFDVAHAMTPRAGNWAAAAAPPQLRTRLLGSLLNIHEFEKPLGATLERFVSASRLAGVFVNSEAGAANYRRAVPDAPLLHVIHNGVSLTELGDRQALRRELQIPDGQFAVACVGRLVPVKRHRDAIAAIPRCHASVTLHLIGDGPLRGELEAQASATAPGRVIFHGETTEVQRLLAAFDAFLMPSESEGFPNALLEAMAAGLPCVATRAGGIPEILEDGRNGLLVPVGEPEKIAAALEQIRADGSLGKRLGLAGTSTVRERFAMQRMLDSMLALYDDTARGSPVGYVISQFPKVSETFILREIVEMRSRGIGCRVVSLKKCREKVVHPDAAALAPLTIYNPPMQAVALAGRALLNPKVLVRLPSTVAEQAALHWRDPRELVKALLCTIHMLALARQLPRLGVRHFHANWASIPAAVAMGAARLAGVTWSFTGHAHDLHMRPMGLREKVAGAAFVATCTQRNVVYLRALADPRDHGKIALVRHFVDLPQREPARTERRPGPYVFLCVASLESYKGHVHLLEAFDRLVAEGRSVELRMVGGGSLTEKLKEIGSGLKSAPHLRWLGALPQLEVFEQMRSSDAFVISSIENPGGPEDNLPNVLVEASLLGRPCIATRIGSIAEFLDDGQNAFLVPPGNAAALAEAMRKLMDDPALAASFATRAGEKATVLFQRNLHADRMEHLLRAAIQSPHGARR